MQFINDTMIKTNIDTLECIAIECNQDGEWMIILEIDGIIDGLKSKMYVVNTDQDGFAYISNKDCRICGYQENWLMKCVECDH